MLLSKQDALETEVVDHFLLISKITMRTKVTTNIRGKTRTKRTKFIRKQRRRRSRRSRGEISKIKQ